jgi:hypothetical protein
MARETELRSRVERLLRGDIRHDDLSRLFLWLRFRTYGAASIMELGHFLGHSDERNTGLATDEAKDFFFLLPFHIGESRQIDLSDVSVDFPKVLTRNLDRISNENIKRATGLKRKHAARILRFAFNKFSLPKLNRRSLQSSLTTEEMAVLQCVISHLIARPAFTDESLFRDFVFVLGKNNLISAAERSLLDHVKCPLSLYAIAAMHHTKLVLEDGSNADLFAGARGGSGGDMLQVVAVAACQVKRIGGSVLVSAPIFSTSLKASDYCAPEMLSLPDAGNLWHGPIEMTSDLKLAPL